MTKKQAENCHFWRDAMTHKLQPLVSNHLNGNLTTAKKQARRHREHRIAAALEELAGFSPRKAQLTAAWLKGADCYQAACDAE